MPTIDYSDVPRRVLVTVALCALIAAALTAYGRDGFGVNFVYSLCIGLLTYASIDLPRRWLWRPGTLAPASIIGLALGAAPVGWFGGSFIASLLLGTPWGSGSLSPNAMLGFLALTAGVGLGCTYYFWTRERLVCSERDAAEARLKALQAQIEPHFLFNTLANLQELIGSDPPRAQKMLGHLDAYLRATLASTRNDRYTLAEEFALLRGFLEILSIRMGPRLTYALDLPAELAAAKLPPMLLQPLVENAIKHGLEPKLDGGSLRVAAGTDGARLLLTVEDNGLGFGGAATAGTGVGLLHVKQRLAASYSGAAGVDVRENPGGGVRITLQLPLEAERNRDEKSARGSLDWAGTK